jgi:hypothetical protein
MALAKKISSEKRKKNLSNPDHYSSSGLLFFFVAL